MMSNFTNLKQRSTPSTRRSRLCRRRTYYRFRDLIHNLRLRRTGRLLRPKTKKTFVHIINVSPRVHLSPLSLRKLDSPPLDCEVRWTDWHSSQHQSHQSKHHISVLQLDLRRKVCHNSDCRSRPLTHSKHIRERVKETHAVLW
jgi:hypothetical protein